MEEFVVKGCDLICPQICAFVTESYTFVFFNRTQHRKREKILLKNGIKENGSLDTNTSKKEV